MILFRHPMRRAGAHLLLGMAALLGTTALSGCGSSSDEAQNPRELLVVYSGDFRGYYEPCG